MNQFLINPLTKYRLKKDLNQLIDYQLTYGLPMDLLTGY